MLRVDQVLVIRHKVLQEGRSVRSVAREFDVSRNTVHKYLSQAEPVRQEYPQLSLNLQKRRNPNITVG